MRYSKLAIFLFHLVTIATAQPLSFNFQQVTTAQGLSMSATKAICEDKYGYIWFGTGNGLNRYDGYGTKVFEHQFGDTSSLLPSPVRYIFCDSDGRLWIGFLNGLMEYDYEKDCFKAYGADSLSWIDQIIEPRPKTLFIATGEGLVKLNTVSGAITCFDSLNTVGRGFYSQVWNIALFQDELLLATRNGITAFNLDSEKHREIKLPHELKKFHFDKLAVRPTGQVWMAIRGENGNIYRTTPHFDTYSIYSELRESNTGQVNKIAHLFFDRQGRLWVSSSNSGIALYDPETNKFRTAPIEPWMPNGLLSASLSRIYQDRNGLIWVQSPKGACYFDPNKAKFQTILPGNIAGADENQLVANTAVETADGMLWIGTGNGLFCYDPSTGKSEHFVNVLGKPAVLHHNSIRTLCLDQRGNLWIGTASGVNILKAGKRHIEFLTEADGLPLVITKSILETSDGTIWVGNFGNSGHYYRLPGTSIFQGIKEHPVLAPYAGRFGQCIFEDSRGCLWFGLDGRGLIYYDPNHQTARCWERKKNNDNTLLGNYVFSLSEDANGSIWCATNMGISVISGSTFQFRNFDKARGLPTNPVTIVKADHNNRIWIGTAQGILVLDSSRQHLQKFDIHDGLPDNECSNRPSTQLRDGRFLFPTHHGYVLFNPDDFSDSPRQVPVLLSDIRVFNQHFSTNTNSENLTTLYLPREKTFFPSK